MAWWIGLYVGVLLIPIILGMLGILQLKWVLLWETVLLLPFILVGLLVLKGTGMDLDKIKRLYLPGRGKHV